MYTKSVETSKGTVLSSLMTEITERPVTSAYSSVPRATIITGMVGIAGAAVWWMNKSQAAFSTPTIPFSSPLNDVSASIALEPYSTAEASKTVYVNVENGLQGDKHFNFRAAYDSSVQDRNIYEDEKVITILGETKNDLEKEYLSSKRDANLSDTCDWACENTERCLRQSGFLDVVVKYANSGRFDEIDERVYQELLDWYDLQSGEE